MKLEDKAFVMDLLGMPRLGLNQAQLTAIERVIDRPQAASAGAAYVPYADAMEALGFTTVAGIRKLAKQGHLTLYKLPGRSQALGVTRESLNRLLAERGAA